MGSFAVLIKQYNKNWAQDVTNIAVQAVFYLFDYTCLVSCFRDPNLEKLKAGEREENFLGLGGEGTASPTSAASSSSSSAIPSTLSSADRPTLDLFDAFRFLRLSDRVATFRCWRLSVAMVTAMMGADIWKKGCLIFRFSLMSCFYVISCWPT